MSHSHLSISIDRFHEGGSQAYPMYVFWLIDSLEDDDEHQSVVLVVKRDDHFVLEYLPVIRQEPIDMVVMNDMFDLSTPESIVQSLRLLHHDFLTKHGLSIETLKTPNKTIESVGLPEGFDV